ncbi:MAG: PQQ-like beta-propeller repeat protein [Blastocatellia bacterium]|nr:PQQ-like beta-propeller repeat protein [Blastocatellia bacterium]
MPPKANLKPLWTAPIASNNQPYVINGKVLVLGFHAGKPEEADRLYAFDASSGRQLWASEMTFARWSHSRVGHDFCVQGVVGPYVYVLDEAKDLRALDLETGRVTNEIKADTAVDDPFQVRMIAAGVVYFVNSQYQLTALRLESGKTEWQTRTSLIPKKTKIDSDGDTVQKIRVEGNHVVVVSIRFITKGTKSETCGTVEGFDLKTGKSLWAYQTKNSGSITELTFGQGNAYVQATETRSIPENPGGTVTFGVNTLIALDLETGKQKWQLIPGGNVIQAEDKQVWVFVSTSDEKHKQVTCHMGVDPATGKELWRRNVEETGTLENQMLWRAAGESSINLEKEYNGDRRGSKMPPGSFIPNNVRNSWVAGFDPLTGKMKWNSEQLQATDMSAASLAGGMLYVTTLAEMKEGKSGLWAYQLPGPKQD